jgi:phosphoglycerate dehydrogenase-like enzyme
MPTILIALKPEQVSAEQRQQIEALAGGRQVVITHQREEIETCLDQIELAVGGFSHDLIPRAPNLRWLQTWGAGTDWLMQHPELADRDFLLTNASGVHAIPISEHIFAFLLAFARKLPRSIRAQEKHLWQRTIRSELFELSNKTMLLIGVGAIGKRTALIAAAMGMRVWGVRRNPTTSEAGIERMVGQQAWLDLLPEADFVVLTVPLTNETHHMVNAEAFARMKPSAHIINIGRGATIDEQAMIEALRSGQIAGAGLDVFATEPLPEDSPLWDMENVITTAHYSGITNEYDQRAMQIFLENLQRYGHGQHLMNLVDKKIGY